jgi:hypothetical protein
MIQKQTMVGIIFFIIVTPFFSIIEGYQIDLVGQSIFFPQPGLLSNYTTQI